MLIITINYIIQDQVKEYKACSVICYVKQKARSRHRNSYLKPHEKLTTFQHTEHLKYLYIILSLYIDSNQQLP